MDEVEQPVRARFLLVRHADATRVDDADAPDAGVVLHVRVTADDRWHLEPVEEEGDPLLGRALGEDVEVVARRGVAVENVADDLRLGQLVQELDLLLAQLRPCLLEEFRRRKTLLVRVELTVGVAAQPRGAVAEAAKPGKRRGRVLAARADVAADHDRRVVRHLREDGVERGEVAVDVVQRRDLRHQSAISSWSRRPASTPPARTIVRSARASRPWRPITLPMSSSATWSRRTSVPSSSSISSTRTASGSSTSRRASSATSSDTPTGFPEP